MRSFKSISRTCMVLLISCAAPAFPAASPAPSPSPSSPEQLVTDYMAALRTEGLTAVSRFLHPEELRRFKEMLMPMFRKDATQKSEVIHGLFGAEATLASVEAMAPEDFMNGFLRVAGEQLKDAEFGEVEVLGTVRENETMHVVARQATAVKGLKIKSMTVISARRAGAGWKLLLTAELEGIAAALSAQ